MKQVNNGSTGVAETEEPISYTMPPTGHSQAGPSGPTPLHFFETVNAYQKTAALKAGVDLGLFTAIGAGAVSSDEIATRCQASERGTRILCDFLVVNGFLTKTGSRYGLTEDSAMFLDSRSPAYLGGATHFLLAPAMVDNFRDLAAIVRNGGTLMPEGGSLAPEHPVWVDFARAMAPMMVMPAQMLAGIVNGEDARPMRVLDIAAGHGLFGITVAQRNPHAEVVALDWPNVLEVAKENAGRMGVLGRYNTLPGSAFEVDFGSGYDVILLTNFLHHFDIETNEALLRKVHAALGGTGRVVTLEFVPNEDRVSPPIPATFSMMMLASTPAGDAYTHDQYIRMYRNAGFARCEQIPLLPSPESAVIGYKNP